MNKFLLLQLTKSVSMTTQEDLRAVTRKYCKAHKDNLLGNEGFHKDSNGGILDMLIALDLDRNMSCLL